MNTSGCEEDTARPGPHHCLSRVYHETIFWHRYSIFFERAGKHCILERVMGGLGCRFDTSPTSLHTRNRYLHSGSIVSWGEKMILLLGGNGLLQKLGGHCWEPYHPAVHPSLDLGGGSVQECNYDVFTPRKHTFHVAFDSPPISAFPFPLMHHFYCIFSSNTDG